MQRGALCADSGPRVRWCLQASRDLLQGQGSFKQERRSFCARAFMQPDAIAVVAAPLSSLSDAGGFSDTLYGLGLDTNAAIADQLAGISPLTFALVLGAGLLTSLSPCTLSVLPLTIGYIGGYSGKDTDGQSKAGQPGPTARAGSFALGLATTLTGLGLVSTSVGRAYGSIGSGLPIAVSVVAIIMGLNLLEVIQLRLPSLDIDVRKPGAPPLLQAYLAGLTFALAASPCSTPVLATLLAYVSTADNPAAGAALLFCYCLGYVAPLLTAAAFTGALSRLLSMRQWSGVITPASGVLLIAGGSYGLLTRIA